MFYSYKLIFLMTLFMGTIISISSYSWMGTWMGLEINLLSFIPLMNTKNNSHSSESSIKYFLIQAIASMIFLFSIILMMMKNLMINNIMLPNNLIMIINSTLMLKIGAAPFHFWFPEIIDGLSWINSLILMTWQKLAPMMIMSYTIKFPLYIMIIVFISTFIGSIGGLNQTSLRKLMAYSSINHIGWMLSSMLINELTWILYFLIYSMMMLSISFLFMKFNVFHIKQMFSFIEKNSMIKFMYILNLLSLGGLPPFTGFIPKWNIIINLSENYYFMMTWMIMMSLITLFFYLRITFSTILMIQNSNNFNLMMNINTKSSMSIMMLTFLSVLSLPIYSYLFFLL